MKALGKTQMAILRCLEEYGDWPGQWVWTTPGQTRKLLEGLVKRDLVEKYTARTTQGFEYDRYRKVRQV